MTTKLEIQVIHAYGLIAQPSIRLEPLPETAASLARIGARLKPLASGMALHLRRGSLPYPLDFAIIYDDLDLIRATAWPKPDASEKSDGFRKRLNLWIDGAGEPIPVQLVTQPLRLPPGASLQTMEGVAVVMIPNAGERSSLDAAGPLAGLYKIDVVGNPPSSKTVCVLPWNWPPRSTVQGLIHLTKHPENNTVTFTIPVRTYTPKYQISVTNSADQGENLTITIPDLDGINFASTKSDGTTIFTAKQEILIYPTRKFTLSIPNGGEGSKSIDLPNPSLAQLDQSDSALLVHVSL